MSKEEFLETLRRTLARELSESEVADHINYYWNYIEQQIAQGSSEEAVLAQLGDPRLIAKTILQVDQRREELEDGSGAFYRDVYEDGDSDTQETYETYGDPGVSGTYEFHTHKMTVTDWIKVALAILILFLILGTVFRILWSLLPFLLIALGVLWVYRRFTGQ